MYGGYAIGSRPYAGGYSTRRSVPLRFVATFTMLARNTQTIALSLAFRMTCYGAPLGYVWWIPT